MVLSAPLSEEALTAAAAATAGTGISVWDGNKILSRMVTQPDLAQVVLSTISAKDNLESQFGDLMRDTPSSRR